ncbi:MAG: 4-hydroxythreonine-4-phosphate dehydrogenase PdxA [Hyphomicrobiaceae bacterium]
MAIGPRSADRQGIPVHDRPLAVTMGDPAGIGPDIILMAWRDRAKRSLPPFVVFAAPDVLAARARALGIDVQIDVRPSRLKPPRDLPSDRLVVIPPDAAQAFTCEPGVANVAAASAIIEAIEQAVSAVMAGDCAALVTCPIAKATLYAAGFPHPGHTEFLGVLAHRHAPEGQWLPVMMLACDLLRVVPLTIHVPLQNVPALLSPDSIKQTIRIVARDLTTRFAIAKPRIVVAGLNPHAGESGTIGREEVDTIAPAIRDLVAEGLDVKGPASADTLFHAEARKRYDAAVCMYHDQALIPIKTLAFDDGVNVTLGLPFVRTSPDHGTAFDIAGTGKARPDSLLAALHMARTMADADAASHSETPA